MSKKYLYILLAMIKIFGIVQIIVKRGLYQFYSTIQLLGEKERIKFKPHISSNNKVAYSSILTLGYSFYHGSC